MAAKDIRTASKLLKDKGLSRKVVTPQKLVRISDQLNKSLSETLNTIAFLKMQGRGFGPFPHTAKVLTGEYS